MVCGEIAPSKFGIFDTLATESRREAHLAGDIARALVAKAKELFAKDPEIHKIEVLAAKAHVAERKQKRRTPVTKSGRVGKVARTDHRVVAGPSCLAIPMTKRKY